MFQDTLLKNNSLIMIVAFLLMQMLACQQPTSNTPHLDPPLPAVNLLRTEVVKFDSGTYKLDLTILNSTGHKIYYERTSYGSINNSHKQLVNGRWKTIIVWQSDLEIVMLADMDSVTVPFYFHDVQNLPSYTTDSLSFYFKYSKNSDMSESIDLTMDICVKHIDREEHE